MVPCLQCGTPCNGPRCPQHQHRYGRAHQTRRNELASTVIAGTTRCPRCHKLIGPGQPWDLDHINGGLHPSHRECNRRTG